MYLLLLPLFHFVFSGALPVGSWDNPPIDWLDEHGLCRQTASLAAECSHCICVKGQSPVCTPIDCPQTLESEDNKCKPGSQWKEECNKCYCDENGISHCTVKDCQKLDHLLSSNKELTHKLEGKLDENGKCITNGSWALDCNICSCSKNGELYCTNYRCAHRHKRASGKINPGGKCKPNERWMLDECNECVCTHTGYASCSLNECPKPKRPKRSPAETELRRLVRGACERGLHFAVDECNTCTCVDGSALDCTQNICAPLSEREKRSPIGSRRTDLF